MEEHFLKWINIVDFKCFHNFEAKDFQRVNLISGKNNVGKTALMEACYVNGSAMDIKSFTGALRAIKVMRENLNILTNPRINNTKIFIERSNGIDLNSNINKSSFKFEEKDGEKIYAFKFHQQSVNVNANNFSYEINPIDNIQFIDSFGLSNSEVIRNFSAIQKSDQENFLNTILREFDNTLESFKVIDELPQCRINGKWLEITEFGDGVRHIISIVTALFQSENGYLFVDEIENGIHFSHLDKVWEVVLEVSKEQNVQVFATTHSKECIESYARVAKKLEDQEIAFIELGKNKDNEIKAITMDYDRLQNEMENTNEVRGW